jgi:predicted P-loop ATPase
MQQAALSYVARGFAVLPVHEMVQGACSCGQPCKSPAKHPRLKNGLLNASKNPAIVAEWWGNTYPATSNVGIRTGRESHIVVLDLDLQKPGAQAAITAWFSAKGGWGSPLIAKTGSGGLHLYYRYPFLADDQTITTTTHLDGVVGLDVRGDGGYVVAPPSLNAAGPYTWLNEGEPGELPAALLDVLTAERKAPLAPAAAETWRPFVTLQRAHLQQIAPVNPTAARILRLEAWAPHGGKYNAMRDLCYALCAEFGPVNAMAPDVWAAVAKSCAAAKAEDPSTTASPEQWLACFQGAWARAEGKAANRRDAAALAAGVASLAFQAAAVTTTTPSSFFTSAQLKALVKKAKDPNVQAILKAASGGTEIPAELEPALEAAGTFVGRQNPSVPPDKIMPAFAHMPLKAEGLAAFRKGIETGHALANDKGAWRRGLAVGENDKPLVCPANAAKILTLHPEMMGVLVFDTRVGNFRFMRPAPWQRGAHPFLSSADAACVGTWLTDVTGVPFNAAIAHEAITSLRESLHQFDGVSTYLEAVQWDGLPRLDTWLIDYASAPDSDYVRAVGSITLIAAAARALRPGCKADTVLILEGSQGRKKSSLIQALCADASWFAEHEGALSGRDKDAVMQIVQGPWLVELGELAGLSKAETNTIKQFVTRKVDRLRTPYGRVVEDFPRKTLFIASTNEGEYLRDTTGNRRWLPVSVGNCYPVQLAAVRDQLWAEAVHRLRAGERWWLEDADLLVAAAEEQAARMETDILDERLSGYLQTIKQPFCLLEVFGHLGIDAANPNSHETRRLKGAILRAGFVLGSKTERRAVMGTSIVTRFFRRPGEVYADEGVSELDAARAIGQG